LKRSEEGKEAQNKLRTLSTIKVKGNASACLSIHENPLVSAPGVVQWLLVELTAPLLYLNLLHDILQ
jgi:hypothetical protein